MDKAPTPGFTVLTDGDVKALIGSLDSEHVSSIAEHLKTAFVAYSVGQESKYQLHRSGLQRPDGRSTLFMPASSSTGVSIKILNVPEPQSCTPLRGALVLCDSEGRCTGIINSEEFTGFRTALGAMLLFQARRIVKHIVMFGAGKQAYWHLRLALVLRSSDIRSITIYDPCETRTRELIDQLQEFSRTSGLNIIGNVVFNILEGSTTSELQLRTQASLQQADVIFCATPSKRPLFPAEWVLGDQGYRKTPYISAIGSYKLDMGELDPRLLQSFATTRAGAYHPTRGDNVVNGLVIIDSREACALEAGEIVQSQLPETNLVEMGEMVDVERNGSDAVKNSLQTWLHTGPIIYKSVGLGIMDLAIGQALINLAREAGIGTRLDEF